MVYIENKEIFTKAIKFEVEFLSNKMIDAVGFILTIIESDSPLNVKKNKAITYATNISIHLKSNPNKSHNSYELILAALGNEGTEKKELIKSLLMIKSNPIEVNLPKINKKQLIKI